MREMTLKEYLANGTQTEVAKALGIYQTAVSQMLAAGRDVRVVVDESGAIIKAFEVKPIGRKTSTTAKAA